MAEYEVVWSEEAKDNLARIFEFYNFRNRSEKFSQTLLVRREKALETLANPPYIGRKTENDLVRVLTIERIRIFYVVESGKVALVRVRDASQHPDA